MTRKLAIVLTLFCCLASAVADTACCRGQNLLTKEKKCLEGQMKQLSCEVKVMFVANESETLVNEAEHLVFLDNNDTLPPDQFCFTKSQTTHKNILVFCYDEPPEENFRIFNVILSMISIVFIVLTIFVYLLVPQLLDTQGICLIQSITGLGLSFIMLGFINLSDGIPHHPCRLIAYLMYFAFMYAFFWLNVLCFHIWKMIVKPQILRCIKRWTLVYHMVGIGGPLILLALVLVANYSDYAFFNGIHPGIGEGKCWFREPTGTFVYFYGPIAVLLSINILYFVWTTVVLCQQMKRCSEKKTKVLKYRLLLTVKLFFIMGIPWAFEIISAVFENKSSRWIWVVSDAINALQGLLIFLILVVCRKKVLRQLANKKLCRWIRLPASWKTAQDDECEELEEELSLSGVHERKVDIPA